MARRNIITGAGAPMEAGERDRVVLIQQRSADDAVDGGGFPAEATWTTLADVVWMRKLDAKGDERFGAQQETAAFDTQWEMGYLLSMDPELVDVPKLRRLVYQGRTFDIVAASQIGRREGIELLTLARTA